MRVKIIRHITIWTIALGVIALIYPLCYRPMAGYWHFRHAEALSMHQYNPSVYDEVEATIALPIIKKSLSYDPRHAETYFFLGLAHNILKNYTETRNAYLSALKYRPNHSRTYYNLGNAYCKLREYEKAIECYEECLKIVPGFESAKNNLEVVKKRLRR